MLKKIEHVGILVKDLQASLEKYTRVFGLPVGGVHEREFLGNPIQIAFLPLGESHIELIAPKTDDGLVAEILKEQGEGIHHIAVEVENIDQAVDRLKTQGMELLWGGIVEGERGVRAAFIRPADIEDANIELIEMPKESADPVGSPQG